MMSSTRLKRCVCARESRNTLSVCACSRILVTPGRVSFGTPGNKIHNLPLHERVFTLFRGDACQGEGAKWRESSKVFKLFKKTCSPTWVYGPNHHFLIFSQPSITLLCFELNSNCLLWPLPVFPAIIQGKFYTRLFVSHRIESNGSSYSVICIV